MNSSYFCSIPSTGKGDLAAFRDAAVTYASCRRQGGLLTIDASPEAWDLIAWLGIEGGRGKPSGISYLDPTRLVPGSVECRTLPAWGRLPDLSLESFRQQGYVAETLFSALIRSSYGPASMEFFPTRSELGFYFDEAQILQPDARWDEAYLQVCQAFFMEELMPGELLQKSLAVLPVERRYRLTELSARWEEELHGVTFLVASQLESLLPLTHLLGALLSLESPAHGLKDLVRSAAMWDPSGWSQAWKALPDARREALAAELCPGFTDQAEAILFTAGPDLLLWRASAASQTPLSPGIS